MRPPAAVLSRSCVNLILLFLLGIVDACSFANLSVSKSLSNTSPSCEGNIDGITVAICHGDITQETTDVIVNGCTSNFDLSRGELAARVNEYTLGLSSLMMTPLRTGSNKLALKAPDPMTLFENCGLCCQSIYRYDVGEKLPVMNWVLLRFYLNES